MSANGGSDGGAPDTGRSFDTLHGVNPQMALDIQHSAMKRFKKRVDELLRELDESEAAPGKVGRDRLSRAHLGSADFKEAQFLYESYTIVHDELENLSRALSAQIEGMGLAVHASQVGYENLDHDIRARMKEVNAEAERYYVPQRDPYARQGDGTNATPETGTPDTGANGGKAY
ncbi:hypothetical protein ACFOOM_32900 [Streptomyces echinoruber]|uniref:Uncharacterized protein n=1 Tax=Streptomyces echinoruber TaxID=68898 RepID=A0A918VPP6_9ACTN|nr:hypothetical protein [Streptomyces echinoruber]GHA13924.1 hypothetical protein GCM10010389_60910 [Streptomyces echinoruber]